MYFIDLHWSRQNPASLLQLGKMKMFIVYCAGCTYRYVSHIFSFDWTAEALDTAIGL